MSANVDAPVTGAEGELDVIDGGDEGEITQQSTQAADTQPQPTQSPPVTNRAQQTTQGQMFALPSELVELQRVVAEFGGADQLRSLLGGLRANADRERAEITGRLVANQSCVFTRDDLAAMTVEQLAKLERSLTPASYVGRAGGGLSANSQREEEWAPYQRPQAAK